VRAEALVRAHDRSLAIAREARRIADLDLDAAIAAAATDLAQLATAGAPAAGRCALVLSTDALLHGDALGAWAAFAAQADAALERQGLTRYRLGAPVVPGADRIDEPLSLSSDGAIDFAPRSAPVGDDGDPVRRFPLVERGIARGLGLTAHEAARRQRDPNGGVRNLVVSPGTWDQQLPAGRTIEVRRLRALAIDRYTGDASLELALAIDHDRDRDRGARRAFTGGTIRLDLIAALARARRSAATVRRGAYIGPAAVLIDDAELIG
ncbi:MAG: metallopeptidase TldD-related protein, partial [Kofleriaceae bacterium]